MGVTVWWLTSSRIPHEDRGLKGIVSNVLVVERPIASQAIGSSFEYNLPLNGSAVFSDTVIESWLQNNCTKHQN